jgi:hypothetical protein
MMTQTQAPVALAAAGAAPATCEGCVCFEGNNGLCKACETCTDCHACLMCGRDHEAPKNGVCPEPRIAIRKIWRIWYAECPLTLTGRCNPEVGCEGFETLPELHGWAMSHVAEHRASIRDNLIRSGAKSLTELHKQRLILDGKGISVLDILSAPLAAGASFWEAQQEFRDAVDELAHLLLACGEHIDFAAAKSAALHVVRGEYEALESLGLSEAA